MVSKVQKFRELHQGNEPLLLGNVWNVRSAKVLEKIGYTALGTSSYAVAETLGYDDGENMPFDEYLIIINRIAKSTRLPLSVDLESGYGTDEEIVISNISKLHELGVVGINIEDSEVTASNRSLVDAVQFSKKLDHITNVLASRNIDMFINVRCDVFLLNLPNKLEEAISRIGLYGTKNIDGIFLPGLTEENDIREIIKATELPLNVLGLPALPNFNVLRELGVKRISIGNFGYGHIYKKLEETFLTIKSDKSFSILFT